MLTRLALVALALAVLAGAAAALAVGGGGGAATAGATVDAVDDSAISLSPAGGPNGDYATLDGDDELVLDFDGLNDDAETAAHDVFRVNATASGPIDVSVHSDAPGVSFYWGDEPTASATDARTLRPGESVAVGVAVDATGNVTDGDFTVRAAGIDDGEAVQPVSPTDDPDGGRLRIESVDVRPRELRAGGTATTTVTVANDGLERREARLTLAIDGTVVATRTVPVPPTDATTVAFERRFDRPGEHAVAVNGVDVGTISVRAGGGVALTNSSVSPASIRPGESATVSADVHNRGDDPRWFSAELAVGGAVVDTRQVRIAPGERTRVAFERTFERRGTYEVAVSGASAGTVRVESATGATMRRYGSQYGWLLGALTVPTVSGALVVARRRQPTWR